MKAEKVQVNVDETRLVSIDGIREFLLTTGSFCREYGKDAEPLIEWGNLSSAWIKELRAQFGRRLRHTAVASKYKFGQFRDPKWPASDRHALDSLCVDDTYRHLVIDDEPLAEMIEKNENDATTSPAFMEMVKRERQIALIGVTTTSCITKTLGSLLPQMERRTVALQRIIAAMDGFASRKSRQSDEKYLLGQLADHPLIIMVPHLQNIQW